VTKDKVKRADEGHATGRRRTGGRSARVREDVLRATWEALLDVGVDGLNFSEIGRRAGVHGTSVQRRWGSRENVLFEALLRFGTQAIPIPDTGSLRGDLVTMSQTVAAYFSSPIGGSILQMLVANADNDRPFADHRAEFLRIRFEAMRVMIRRAAERGELRPGVDEETALDLALGPLYVRTLITRQPIDDAFIERCIDTLLQGLGKSA
jgi:AcrR family transcriptional regulator